MFALSLLTPARPLLETVSREDSVRHSRLNLPKAVALEEFTECDIVSAKVFDINDPVDYTNEERREQTNKGDGCGERQRERERERERVWVCVSETDER